MTQPARGQPPRLSPARLLASSCLPFSCLMGNALTSGGPVGGQLRLTEAQWATHIALLGPTGMGKSCLQRQIFREHRRARRGICVIDTGDLAADVLADLAHEVFFTGNTALLKKIHYVKLDPTCLPRYHPWRPPPMEGIPEELRPVAERFWQHTRVHERLRVFQANTTGSTSFLNQPRRHRVMTNALLALSTQAARGHLDMEDVFLFLDPAHPHHPAAVARVAPYLPPEVHRDLETLGGLRRLEDLRREVESSINSLRMTLGEGLKLMLSGRGEAPSLDLREIITGGHILIVDAQQSSFVNHEQNVALASLLALDYCETAMNLPRAQRGRSTLLVDETPELLAPLSHEIGRWLRILRKYGVACCLSFQDLVSLKREDVDLAPVVLGQCGTIISFRSRWPSDAEILSRVLMTGNLSFEPLVHEVERHPGHEFVPVDDYSESYRHDVGRADARGTQAGTSSSQVTTQTQSRTHGETAGRSHAHSLDARGQRRGESLGKTASAQESRGEALAQAQGLAESQSASQSHTDSETRGWAVSINHKLVPLPIVVRELQETGQLRQSINDQFARFTQELHGQGARQAILLAPGMKAAVPFLTAEVREPFCSPEAQAQAVAALKRQLQETHDYYFVPSLDPALAEARIAGFAAGNTPGARQREPLDPLLALTRNRGVLEPHTVADDFMS